MLHARHYQAKELSVGHILYRVAKYDQRVADMFYGPRNNWFQDKSVFSQHSDRTQNVAVLSRLKADPSDPNLMSQAFNSSLFFLLDRGTRLVKEVKKNKEISTERKPREAYLLVAKEYLQQQEGKNIDQLNEVDVDALMEVRERQSAFKNWIEQAEEGVLIESVQKIIEKTFEIKIKAAKEAAVAEAGNISLWGNSFRCSS